MRRWLVAGWPALAARLESFSRSRGIDFGMIHFGEPSDASDAAWLARSQERFEAYETAGGGRPDHVLLQSWQNWPDYVLPESNPVRYTNLVNRYARPRPALSVALAAARDGSRTATGTLTDARGRPLAGVPVEIAVAPRYGGPALPPEPLAQLTATTGADGAYAAALPGVGPIGVSVEARYAGSAALWPAFAAAPAGPAGRDVAEGRPATASSSLQSPPGDAFDGSYDTTWGAGDGPPQWIEVDLGAPTSVGQIRLVAAQFPDGPTRHVVYGRGADGTLQVLHEFARVTADGQVLVYTPPSPWTGIRAIRVETIESPSWVAWREIEAWSW